jgi:SAM-dependent methyltransferase
MDAPQLVLNPEDIARVLGEPLSPRIASVVKNLAVAYSPLSPEERDACIKNAVGILLDPVQMDKSGEHRLEKWEKGWTHNLEALKSGGKEGLLPVYFSAERELTRWAKWRQEYVKPAEKGFDFKVLSIFLSWAFEKYAAQAPAVYEFGCGTGHHLLRLREFNPTAEIWGLDWAEASQKIIAEMTEKGIAANTFGKKFDFFHPDAAFALKPGSVVYTVGALEQVGSDHDKFLEYLLKNKPERCFHIEPVWELLDENNLLDYLVIQYFKRRNYLSNFVSKLRELESAGKIVLEKASRTYLGGSLLTEYSVVVWRPT